MTGPATPQAGRPSSQELAARVRESLVNTARWTSQEDYRYDERDSGLAALDILSARLQATEQALDAIEAELGTLPPYYLGPAIERSVNKAWAMAREKRPDPELVPRALEGAAE